MGYLARDGKVYPEKETPLAYNIRKLLRAFNKYLAQKMEKTADQGIAFLKMKKIIKTNEFIRIRNFNKLYCNIEWGSFIAEDLAVTNHSSHWSFEEIKPFEVFKIKNRLGNGNYLNIEEGTIRCSNIESGWESSTWKIVLSDKSGYFKIESAYKPGLYISVYNNEITLTENTSDKNSLWIFEAI